MPQRFFVNVHFCGVVNKVPQGLRTTCIDPSSIYGEEECCGTTVPQRLANSYSAYLHGDGRVVGMIPLYGGQNVMDSESHTCFEPGFLPLYVPHDTEQRSFG